MENLNEIVRKNILDMEPYSSARSEFNKKDAVFIDANENPYGLLNRYPDPYQTELKERIGKIKGVDQNQVFIGNGSDEIIDLIYRVFCEPGTDKAMIFSPTYGMYQVLAELNNVGLIEEPLNANYQLDLERIRLQLDEPNLKIIWLCSPNNPTGNLIKREDIIQLLNLFKGLVVIDEAYIDFCAEQSWVNELDRYPNLIIVQTMSKAWGLAGARVGLAYANRSVIKWFNKVKPPYNVSLLNQKEALKALENADEFDHNIGRILGQRNLLEQAFSKLAIVNRVYPSDTNFLLVEFNQADVVYDTLIEQKIIVRNRHRLVRNCLRITVGTAEENILLIKALNAIKL